MSDPKLQELEAATRAAEEKLNHITSAVNALPNAESQAVAVQPWDAHLVIILGVSILVFALVVLWLATKLLAKSESGSYQVLKIFGLVLIVCMSAFLMIVGYDKDQLTPIVGLFGAIAGYLLGKEAPEAKNVARPAAAAD